MRTQQRNVKVSGTAMAEGNFATAVHFFACLCRILITGSAVIKIFRKFYNFFKKSVKNS
jgi:hypothetical protein